MVSRPTLRYCRRKAERFSLVHRILGEVEVQVDWGCGGCHEAGYVGRCDYGRIRH